LAFLHGGDLSDFPKRFFAFEGRLLLSFFVLFNLFLPLLFFAYFEDFA
jgi:hypothetical protein